jgi:thioredoxin 1
MNRRELVRNSVMPRAAHAQEPYQAQSLESAIASGPVVVHVYASWCPVCQKQKPILAALARDQALAGVRFVTVDFDKDRQFLRTYRVGNQSVILLFKSGQEVVRLIGITDAESMRARLLGAL